VREQINTEGHDLLRKGAKGAADKKGKQSSSRDPHWYRVEVTGISYATFATSNHRFIDCLTSSNIYVKLKINSLCTQMQSSFPLNYIEQQE